MGEAGVGWHWRQRHIGAHQAGLLQPKLFSSSKFFPQSKGNLTNHGAVLILLSAQIGGKGSALISEKP